MILLVLVSGLLCGSFLSVVIYRLPRRESVVRPPSHCPQCRTTLAWFDLAPLISYLALRGRCRHCGGRVGFRYPAVEALTAVLFLTVYLMLQYKAGAGFLPESARPFWVLAKELFFVAGLIAASFIDLEHRIIPNRLVLGLLAGAVLLVPLAGDVELTAALLGGTAAGGALLLLAVLFRDGMGGGDIKLAAVAGLYLGWPMVMLGLFLGALLGSFFGVLLILAGRKSRKDFIPFGPYLAVGFFIALLWGEQILRWYRI